MILILIADTSLVAKMLKQIQRQVAFGLKALASTSVIPIEKEAAMKLYLFSNPDSIPVTSLFSKS